MGLRDDAPYPNRIGKIASRSKARTKSAPLFDPEERRRWRRLDRCLDTVRDRFGYSSIVAGGAIEFLGQFRHDSHGYILRTPSLTK